MLLEIFPFFFFVRDNTESSAKPYITRLPESPKKEIALRTAVPEDH